MTSGQAFAVGIGVAGGVVGLLGILGGVLFVRRKHRLQLEVGYSYGFWAGVD